MTARIDLDALKAAYLANDARLKDIAARFGMSMDRLCRIVRKCGWTRPLFVSPKTRAWRSANHKAKSFKPTNPGRKRTRPPAGTDEHRLFRKIAYRAGLGAAAAHAELRRAL